MKVMWKFTLKISEALRKPAIQQTKAPSLICEGQDGVTYKWTSSRWLIAPENATIKELWLPGTRGEMCGVYACTVSNSLSNASETYSVLPFVVVCMWFCSYFSLSFSVIDWPCGRSHFLWEPFAGIFIAVLSVGLAFLFRDGLPRERLQYLGRWEGCGECHPDKCFTELRCPAGRVKDACGCCWECGGAEGQPCDPDPSARLYGPCGEGLRCQILEQDLMSGEAPEPQCVCVRQEVLCGSDGHTYENACQLRAAQERTAENGKLSMDHQGPCKAKPAIVTAPRDVTGVEGNDIIFSCEVSAYPMAMIEWRKEGNSVFLPADDSHMAVQARGGPRRFELTGWLQIENVRQRDGGVYTCAARNEFGEVHASARLQVVEKDGRLSVRAPVRSSPPETGKSQRWPLSATGGETVTRRCVRPSGGVAETNEAESSDRGECITSKSP
ncbi:kazal-type serine protease inhibitor domain-containing protein 1-like [Megalops cyprinoides]|uniref:kazal-type serine protease inhibitor domain-containing protein 1-like n=1 Tax=Megalops cyprinoides TaxID=118141 RepID=UPI0018652507|nr:kazal-type serine protease inhibitor domain-containing protein 1-like [Megalops cyprinoides]